MRTIIVLAAVLAVALAEGQFYVPRAYYTIDSAGHESIPVPLQRLRRSYNLIQPQPTPQPQPQPYPGAGSWSNAASGANSWSNSGSGSGYAPPVPGGYGSSAPNLGHTYGVSGTFGGLGSGDDGASPSVGRFVSSSASINLDSNGQGRYASSVGTYPID